MRTSRRSFLTVAASATATGLLAACGGFATAPASAPAAAPTTPPAAAPPTSTKPAGAAQPTTAAAAATPAASPAATQAGPGRLKPTTLKLALNGSQDTADRLKKLLDGFKAQQPDITVEIMLFQAADWDQFFEKLLTQIAAGQMPDIVNVATEGAQLFAGRGLATPLDDYVKRDRESLREYFKDVSPTLIEAMLFEGKLYSLPDNFNAANLYYSRAAFDRKGVPYPSNWTRDQFAEALPKLATMNGGQTTEWAYFWTNRMWGGALPWIFLNGGNILTEERAPGGEWLWNEFYKDDPAAKSRGGGFRWNKSTASQPQNIEALEFLSDLTNKLKVAPSPSEADGANAQINTVFANGQLATFVSGGFLVRGLVNAGVDPSTFSVTHMPRWKTQRHQFGTAGFMIMDKSPNKDAAWEMAKFRVASETVRQNFANSSSVPTRRSLVKELYEDTYKFKDWQVFYDTLDKFPDTAPIPQPVKANQVTAIFTKYVGLAMTQDMTPKAALEQMDGELTELLKS